MWICLNDAFVSAVQSERAGELKVRARKREHLESLLLGLPIVETDHTDYRYRVFVDQAVFAELVADRVRGIDYTNFKNSVKAPALHSLYLEFWTLHHKYQSDILKREEKGDRAGHMSWSAKDVTFSSKRNPE